MPLEMHDHPRGQSSSSKAMPHSTAQAMSLEPELLPVQFDEHDPSNPRNWSPKKKSLIGLFVLVSGFVATFGTPIYVSAIPSVAAEFHISTTLATSPVTLYAFGLGAGALLATGFSEVFGRAITYRVTIPIAFAFIIVGGSAQNFATIDAARFLSGLFLGPCLTIGVGVLNDLWDLILEKTGTTFAVLFAVMVIWAAEVGPMASGALLTYRDWRWSFWILAILTGILAVTSFAIPETYSPQILRKRAIQLHLPVANRGTLFSILLASFGRPFHMTLVEPLIFPAGLVMAVTQSIIFAYYVVYAILFEQTYGFTQYQVGMSFAPLLVGSLLAIPVMGLFDRITYKNEREIKTEKGNVAAPERRLFPAILGSIIMPISLFWFAWTGRPSIHWAVPCLSGLPMGLAYVLTMLCMPMYTNDVYTTHFSASVLAATTFIRFTISSVFPLFSAQMVEMLGFSWATSLLGFITLAMIPIPFVFFKWGPTLRSKSRYLKM